MSHQVLHSREELHERLENLKRKYKDEIVPRPENWGGFLVKPTWIEFWQGQEGRLHDRLCYRSEAGGDEWRVERLSP